MPSSTAEREKLINGGSLLLIAGLFLAAFTLLRPSEKDFQLAAIDDPMQSAKPLDELELAYLRARVATGEQSPAEVSHALGKMIRAQQFSAAGVLLLKHPDVQISGTDRFRLELEMLVTADDLQPAGLPVNPKLTTKLRYLLSHPSLQSTGTLLRASQLSHKLSEPGLSAKLYYALGQHDDSNAAHWYEQCENYANAGLDSTLAQTCLHSAIEKTTAAETRFALKLNLLENLAQENANGGAGPGDALAQEVLLNELLAEPSLSASQLESLAATLLAVKRPHSAIGVYEELATADPQRQVHWLDQAIRWSVATSQNLRAVALLERTRAQLDAAAQAELDQRVEVLLIAAGEQ